MKRVSRIAAFAAVALLLSACTATRTEEMPEQTEVIATTEVPVFVETEESPVYMETTEVAEVHETTEPEITEATAPEITEAMVQETVSAAVAESREDAYTAVLDQYRKSVKLTAGEIGDLYWNEADVTSMISCLEYDPELVDLSELGQYLKKPTFETEYPYVNGNWLYWSCYTAEDTQTIDPAELAEVHFAYRDLDGNGTDELVIASVNAEDSAQFSVIGIYALSDGEPVTVENTVGSRSYVLLYEGGIICYGGSHSASGHGYTYYRLDGQWGWLNQICSFTINYDDSDVEDVIALQDMFSSGLTPITEFDWKPLFADEV